MAVTAKSRLRCGVTFIDTLVATIIVTVAMLGCTGIYFGVTNLTAKTSEMSVAESLARRAVEEARSQGFYWCTTPNTGVGCDGTNNLYYDGNGQLLGSSTGAHFKVSVTVTSTSLTSGVPDNTALRTLLVTVWRTDAANTILEKTGTYLSWGGV